MQIVQGKPLDGPGLADLIQQVVEGLNERDIPTGGWVGGWVGWGGGRGAGREGSEEMA